MADPDTEMRERMGGAVVEWARRIPVDQIPCVLVLLAGRLVAEGSAGRNGENDRAGAPEEKLLTASELAALLNLPESWVRTEERAGRIPSIRLGKYVRFKLSEVERTLAERQRQGV